MCSSISFASLRAISTGRTSDLKARENVPSTSPASLDSRLRSTLMGGYPDGVAMIAGAQYPASASRLHHPYSPEVWYGDREKARDHRPEDESARLWSADELGCRGG